MLVERIDIVNLDLEVDSHPQAGVGKLLGVGFLGMNHQSEVTKPKNGQAIRCSLVLGMNLEHLGADHLVIELERPANVLDVQEDARDSGRHSTSLQPRSLDKASEFPGGYP